MDRSVPSSPDLSSSEMIRGVTALFVSIRLATRGYERGSLSSRGAFAAFVVGFLSCAASYRFGATLIMFYLLGTKATKFRAEQKAKIEDQHKGPGGTRSATQVLASSGPAVFASTLYLLLFRYDAPILRQFQLRSSLNLFYMLFFAACAGDTLSSEIGIVLPAPGTNPILITAPWRTVPRGTNGGITWQGTVASAFGGVVVGAVYYVLSPDHAFDQLILIPLGLFGGAVGSLIDSILGSMLQLSVQDVRTGKVLDTTSLLRAQDPSNVRYICGRNIFSGEIVNAIAAVLTGAMAPFLLSLCF